MLAVMAPSSRTHHRGHQCVLASAGGVTMTTAAAISDRRSYRGGIAANMRIKYISKRIFVAAASSLGWRLKNGMNISGVIIIFVVAGVLIGIGMTSLDQTAGCGLWIISRASNIIAYRHNNIADGGDVKNVISLASAQWRRRRGGRGAS